MDGPFLATFCIVPSPNPLSSSHNRHAHNRAQRRWLHSSWPLSAPHSHVVAPFVQINAHSPIALVCRSQRDQTDLRRLPPIPHSGPSRSVRACSPHASFFVAVEKKPLIERLVTQLPTYPSQCVYLHRSIFPTRLEVSKFETIARSADRLII